MDRATAQRKKTAGRILPAEFSVTLDSEAGSVEPRGSWPPVLHCRTLRDREAGLDGVRPDLSVPWFREWLCRSVAEPGMPITAIPYTTIREKFSREDGLIDRPLKPEYLVPAEMDQRSRQTELCHGLREPNFGNRSQASASLCRVGCWSPAGTHSREVAADDCSPE